MGRWTANPDAWVLGCRELKESAIGCPAIGREYAKLASMGWILCRPHTPLTTELMSAIHGAIDRVANRLQVYPGVAPGGYYSDRPFDAPPDDGYPLGWLAILGALFHPLMLKHADHLQFGLSPGIKSRRYK